MIRRTFQNVERDITKAMKNNTIALCQGRILIHMKEPTESLINVDVSQPAAKAIIRMIMYGRIKSLAISTAFAP